MIIATFKTYIQALQLKKVTVVIVETIKFTDNYKEEAFLHFSPVFKICNQNILMAVQDKFRQLLTKFV